MDFTLKVLSELLDGGASELMNSFATSRHPSDPLRFGG